MSHTDTDHRRWPERPWALAGLLAFAGLLTWLASDGNGPDTNVAWRAALTALAFFGSLAFAFTVERDRWKAPLAFAAIAGLVMAGLAWRAVSAGDRVADPEFGFLAGLIATGIALPLFQSGFHRTRFATPYARIHRNVWDDAICAGGSLVFLGASWLLLFVLSELFHLIKIDVLRDLAQEEWFGWAFSGAAFGAALGTLRNELGIIGTLKNVVMVVLSILAVPLAAGLALFLAAMIVSGPDVLWQATRSATPILLVCAAGAWVLANAIVRDDDGEMTGNRALRAAAMVLALSILPLTVFAAVSMGTRVAQHGLSPERLWGLVAIAVATAYGLAWVVAVVRGWQGAWRDNLRRANLHLAVVISAVALFLALPILDFGAISARQQIARLESGAVSADDFDYAALRWDFGDAGRRALARLAKSEDADVAKLAQETQELAERPYRGLGTPSVSSLDLRMQTPDPALERLVRNYLRSNSWQCSEGCVAIDLGRDASGNRRIALVFGAAVETIALDATGARAPEAAPAAPSLKPDSKVELRTIQRRQVFVDGQPVGQPIE